jgi:hypothetical protein
MTATMTAISHLEDHYLLQGCIAIIGLADIEKFKQRAEKFLGLFDRKQISYSEISKALLTIGDYSQLASWRFLLGNNNDSTWRQLFTISKMRKHFD